MCVGKWGVCHVLTQRTVKVRALRVLTGCVVLGGGGVVCEEGTGWEEGICVGCVSKVSCPCCSISMPSVHCGISLLGGGKFCLGGIEGGKTSSKGPCTYAD